MVDVICRCGTKGKVEFYIDTRQGNSTSFYVCPVCNETYDIFISTIRKV
jgi:hypothetical protein